MDVRLQKIEDREDQDRGFGWPDGKDGQDGCPVPRTSTSKEVALHNIYPIRIELVDGILLPKQTGDKLLNSVTYISMLLNHNVISCLKCIGRN